MALIAQLTIYAALLQRPLRAAQADLTRPALVRWFKVVAVWQAAVLLAAGGYMAVMTSRHTLGAAWIAPPVGALFGSAVPLQLVVIAVLRAARR